MKPLRVLQIIPSISIVYGGPSQMVLGLSKGLAAQGVDVTILTTDANGDVGQVPLAVPFDQPVVQDGYRIRYFHCSPFRRYKFSYSLLRWLHRHAPEYDVAHIHALFSPVSSLAARIAADRELPYILRPLGTLDPADLQKKRRLKRLYAQFLERSNLARAAALHFTSDQEAKVSERFGVFTRDVVVPLGVHLQGRSLSSNSPRPNPVRTTFGIPEETPILLFMSRLDRKKGLDLLFPALEQLLAEGESFHLLLAGSNAQDPGYEQQIRHQLQSSPLANHVSLTGFVSGDDKADFLEAADVFVLPSYYENFGIAVAEAMAAAVPVVISDQVYIWPDVQQAEAGWISPCESRALANQIRCALQDPSERRRRGLNAQRYAQTHCSWDAIAQQMIGIYQSILVSQP